MIPFWTDSVEVLHNEKAGETQRISVSLTDLRTALMADPFGSQEVRAQGIVDLTNLSAKFTNLLTVPAGCILQSLGLIITQLVVAGGTTVKLGLGLHGSTPSVYGKTADLLKNTQFSTLVGGSPLGSDTAIDLSGVTTAGTALGDTNISAGQVFISISYLSPGSFQPES